MVVFSEGVRQRRWALPKFQTALISALLLSGLLCDRFGIGVGGEEIFTPWRITGALFAVIATILPCRHSGTPTSLYPARYPPFLAGLPLAGSLWKCESSPRQRAPCWCPLHGTSSSALCPRRGAGDMYRISHVTIQLPDMVDVSGGPLGLLSIGLRRFLARLRPLDAGRSQQQANCLAQC